MRKYPTGYLTEKALCENRLNKLPDISDMMEIPCKKQTETSRGDQADLPCKQLCEMPCGNQAAMSAFTGIPVKLRSRTGESIAETLVALLIGSVALVMLAGMITTSAHLITKSKTLMETYYNNNKSLETKPDTSSGSLDITIQQDPVDVGTPSSSTTLKTPLPGTISVKKYENDTIAGKSVISYKDTP